MEKSLFTEDYAALLGHLRAVREQAGVSQVEIAERLGTGQSLISKCERGERRLDVLELRRWILALELSFPDFLLEFEALLKKKKSRPSQSHKKH